MIEIIKRKKIMEAGIALIFKVVYVTHDKKDTHIAMAEEQ